MTRNVRLSTKADLRFESLEQRRLLAVGEFYTQLLVDNDGVPGQEITDQSLTTGQSFFLKIDVQEFDPHHRGLQSIAVDLQWDSGLIEVISEDFNLDEMITPHLPFWRVGELDNDAGRITDLGATVGMMEGRPIGSGVSENFALIRMRAGDTPGIATIALEKSQLKTILFPTAVLSSQHLQFDSETIQIVPRVETPSLPTPDLSIPAPSDGPTQSELTTESTQPSELFDLESEISDLESDDMSAAKESSNLGEFADPVIDSVQEDVQSTEDMTTIAPTIADAVFSFDANNDGVFDLSDLGWINVAAFAAAVSPGVEADEAVAASSANMENAEVAAMESFVSDDAPIPGLSVPEHTCIAFPELGSIAAAERWLDALARAWIADEELRARRRAAVAS